MAWPGVVFVPCCYVQVLARASPCCALPGRGHRGALWGTCHYLPRSVDRAAVSPQLRGVIHSLALAQHLSVAPLHPCVAPLGGTVELSPGADARLRLESRAPDELMAAELGDSAVTQARPPYLPGESELASERRAGGPAPPGLLPPACGLISAIPSCGSSTQRHLPSPGEGAGGWPVWQREGGRRSARGCWAPALLRTELLGGPLVSWMLRAGRAGIAGWLRWRPLRFQLPVPLCRAGGSIPGARPARPQVLGRKCPRAPALGRGSALRPGDNSPPAALGLAAPPPGPRGAPVPAARWREASFRPAGSAGLCLGQPGRLWSSPAPGTGAGAASPPRPSLVPPRGAAGLSGRTLLPGAALISAGAAGVCSRCGERRRRGELGEGQGGGGAAAGGGADLRRSAGGPAEPRGRGGAAVPPRGRSPALGRSGERGLPPTLPAPRGPGAARVKREPRPLASGMLWPRSRSAALGVCALLAPSPGATVTGSGSAGGAAGGRGCALKSLCPRQRSAAGSHREPSGEERREPPLCCRRGNLPGPALRAGGLDTLQRYPAGVRQRGAAGRRALAPRPCRSGRRVDGVSALRLGGRAPLLSLRGELSLPSPCRRAFGGDALRLSSGLCAGWLRSGSGRTAAPGLPAFRQNQPCSLRPTPRCSALLPLLVTHWNGTEVVTSAGPGPGPFPRASPTVFRNPQLRPDSSFRPDRYRAFLGPLPLLGDTHARVLPSSWQRPHPAPISLLSSSLAAGLLPYKVRRLVPAPISQVTPLCRELPHGAMSLALGTAGKLAQVAIPLPVQAVGCVGGGERLPARCCLRWLLLVLHPAIFSLGWVPGTWLPPPRER